METATRGVLLAIAILLLWLAGLAFFIAFEGSKLLAGVLGGAGATPLGAADLIAGLEQGLAGAVSGGAASSSTAGGGG